MKSKMAALGQEEYPSLATLLQDVYQRRKNLLQVVELLGPSLTSTDTDKRCSAVQLLSSLLQKLVNYKLTDREVELLCEFYCDRLKDHYSIIPQALLGLQALASHQSMPGERAVILIQTLFKEVHTQSLMQSGRYTVYSLLASLLDKNMKDLKPVGSDLVFGFLQAMDGEKDPRNLVVAFKLARIIIKNFPIGLFAEDLFEVTSCYFPIDFTPATDDPYGLTKDDLVLGLRRCLAATSQFAPFCLPLLMEKLSSDVINAKIDSLLTLSTCLEEYPPQQIKDYLQPLWQAIKREVFQTVSSELEDAALKALSSIIKNLESSSQPDVVEFKTPFLDCVIKECCANIEGADLRKVKPSGQLLQAAFVTDTTYNEITSTAVPLILSKYNDEATQGLVKKLLLDVLLGLLTASKPYYKRKGSVLASHTSALVDVLFSALVSDSPSLCRAAIAGLVSMVTLPGLLLEQKVGMFVEHLTSFVLSTKDLTVRQESNAALAFLAMEFPELIKTKLVSVLAEQLQKEDGSAMDEENISHLQSDKSHPQYDQMLNTLSAVCTEEGVVRHVVPIILDHGEYLVTGKDLERGVLHGKISETLKCLNSIVKGTLQSSTVEPNYYTEVVIYRIIDLCTQSALQESPDCPMATPEALALVCSIVRQVISHLAVNEAEDVLHIIVSNFIEGKTPLSARAEQKFAPLEPSSPWQQSQLVTVLMAAVCSARREVRIPRQKELVPRLQVLASGCNHRKTTVAASKCLGGIINKMAQGDDLTADLHSLKGQLQNHMDGNEEQRWRAVITWLWLTRALVTRSHPMAQEFVQKVLHLLDDVSVGRVAADGFYVIVSDCDDVMNQAMHADIKMMYKQRFFMETLPLLLKGFHDTRPECKYLYLCALSHLLQWIPKQVLLTEIPTLMPMLIQALSRDEPSLLLSTLQTLYSLVFDAPEVISRQVTSLIPNFLELAKCKASMKVRMEAIKCLGAMTTLEHHVVYVYKARVIKELACTLDDPKRLVRAEAVKCRNEWYLLGSSAR